MNLSWVRRWTWLLLLVVVVTGCTDRSWRDLSTWGKKESTAPATGVWQPSQDGLAPPPVAAPLAPVQAATVPQPIMPVKAKVALLLPLSGPNAELGQAMLRAAEQAVFDAAAANFELMPRNTGESDLTTEAAARQAVQDGAQLIIGPVFAAKVPAVRRGAGNTPILTLSTDMSVAAANTYVMGFGPAAQTERVARYAVGQGLRRIGVLVPSNAYGAVVGQALQTTVAAAGGTVVAIESFDPTKHDSDRAVHALADYRTVMDALFVPVGGEDVVLISKQLKAAGFDASTTRLLGTGLWDAPDMGQRAPLVVGGWYAAPDPATRQNFITTYKAAHGNEPPRLSSLAYDATALAATLAKRGARYDVISMTNPNGFAGLDGIFRLRSDGMVERGLAILAVGAENGQIVDPSPLSFAGYGR